MDNSEEESEECQEEVEDSEPREDEELVNENRRVSFSNHTEKKKESKKSKRRHSINVCQGTKDKRLILDLSSKIHPMREEDEQQWSLPTPSQEERSKMQEIEKQLLEQTFQSLNIVRS